MATSPAQASARPTMLIAIEQSFPKSQRVVTDNLAYQMLPFSMRALTWLFMKAPFRNWMIRVSERDLPGVWGGMMCRKRYIGDKVLEAVDQVDAAVNLGAGYDTLPYRLPATIQVWEVDKPEIMKSKQDRVRAVLGRVPENVSLVSTNFEHEELAAVHFGLPW